MEQTVWRDGTDKLIQGLSGWLATTVLNNCLGEGHLFAAMEIQFRLKMQLTE
jgi:hypothetical protein